MIGAQPSRLSLILGALIFAVMGLGGAFVAFDSARTTLSEWSSPEVSVGAGATIAMPFVAAFLFALGVATTRAISQRQPPVEKMGRLTWIIGAMALASIPIAGAASVAMSHILQADGYRPCGHGSLQGLGVVHWRRKDLLCASPSSL